MRRAACPFRRGSDRRWHKASK